MEKFALSFEFNGRPYHAVILVKQKSGGREFSVTELDEELERLLADNHVIREVDGNLDAGVLTEKKEQTHLKLTIGSRLSEYLNMACFVGNECLTPHAHIETWQELHPLLRRSPY